MQQYDLNDTDLTDEERKYHPQKKFKSMLGHFNRSILDGQNAEQAFINLKYPIMAPKDTGCDWKLIALNHNGQSSHVGWMDYIDFMGNIGSSPVSDYRLTRQNASLSEIINAFANAELQLALQGKTQETPFETLSMLLSVLKEEGVNVTIEDSLVKDIEMSYGINLNDQGVKKVKKIKVS